MKILRLQQVFAYYIWKNLRERLYGKSSQEQSKKESEERLSGTHADQRRTQDTEQEAACRTLGKRITAFIISPPGHNKRQDGKVRK